MKTVEDLRSNDLITPNRKAIFMRIFNDIKKSQERGQR